MKTYIRTLWADDKGGLWAGDDQREALRKHLNDWGFYALTGAGDSLDVYAVGEWEPVDIILAKKSLAKIQKAWYKMRGR